MSAPSLHDLSSVIHVHSTYSDGTATVPEILDAARDAGRDAVLLTDHDSLEAKRDGWEGWHDGVLLLVGEEVSPRRAHFLAFDIDEEIDRHRVPVAEVPGVVASRGGFSFAAHPFPHRLRLSKLITQPHPMGRLVDPALCGVELWNLANDTVARFRHPLEALRFLRYPDRELADLPPTHLEAWDRLSAQRRTVAVGALDSHQPGIRLRGRVRTPLPNRILFGLLGTHLLLDAAPTGELERDRGLLYAALCAGRCYISRDSLADPRGFEFWAEPRGAVPVAGDAVAGAGRLEMGDEAPAVAAGAPEAVAAGGASPAPGWTIRARLPQAAELRLLRDGSQVASAEADALEHSTDSPGVYRLEARLRAHGTTRIWILSNPIHLRSQG